MFLYIHIHSLNRLHSFLYQHPFPYYFKMNKNMNIRTERPQRRKTPSFSSILLDSVYHSLDETRAVEETRQDFYRKDDVLVVEQDEKSLRRAIMLEKWMEKNLSDSSSSADSSFFSFSETEHTSRSTPKSLSSSSSSSSKLKHSERTQTEIHESRFTRTKSRVLKIYGVLKKVKQPMSPGTKIANFLNSVFTSRNLKKHHHHHHQQQHQSSPSEGWSSMRKSKSVKDPTIFSSLSSTSCLSKAPSSRTKSKRSVRFGPVSVIEQYDPRIMTMQKVGSNFIKQNIHNLSSFQDMKSEESEDDDDTMSCTSSDLFELDNISFVRNEMHKEELPVFGTTNMKINQAIANSYLFS